MLAAYCVVAMLAHVMADSGTTPRRVYGHLATLIGAVALMTGLLLAADVEFAEISPRPPHIIRCWPPTRWCTWGIWAAA
jgi:hypothetical protein